MSAAVFSGGRMLERVVEVPTPLELEPEEFAGALAGIFLAAAAANGCDPGDIAGLGLGVPSTIDYSRDSLDPSPNLPKIADYHLAQRLSARLGFPVAMENDANCFALGEFAHGAAAGCANCCGITLGTGLGLGVVLEGKLLRGAHGCSGEIWHAPYGAGIFEDRVSGRALEKQYELAGGGALSGAEIHLRAAAGEPRALEVFEDFGAVLGHGLAWLVNLLDPEIIVIGGSVARAWEFFERPLRRTVDSYRLGRNRTRIVQSNLGNWAVLYGAMALLKEQ